MNRVLYKSICYFCCVLVLICSGCSARSNENKTNDLNVVRLNESRPQNATGFPNVNLQISDVRVQVAKRNARLEGNGFEDINLMQIYYGYYSDGQWFDYPSENYELVGILDNHTKKGYDAAGGSNIVKIGPYLLIAISLPGFDDYPERYNVVTDTLGSTVSSITAYYTVNDSKNAQKYGYLKENVRKLNTDSYEFVAYNTFNKWYYTVIKYDDLHEGYEMKIVTHTIKGDDDESETFVLTYQDIKKCLS